MDSTPEATGHFFGIILAVFMAAAYGRAGRSAPFWMIMTRLPGTFLHELAHYAVAFVTGGSPSGFTIIPVRRESIRDGVVVNEWVLGSVTLRKPSALSAMPTGLAPLLLLGVAWHVYCHWFEWFPHDFPHTICLYGVLCLLCCGSVPSGRDLHVAVSSISGMVLYCLLAAMCISFTRIVW